ncbi:MAG: helix-turn-helix domain-containing protein [Chloroflexi bacterium]|nr:helix-turn-helix domain-containing protein [Chloroflexota bacterium]
MTDMTVAEVAAACGVTERTVRRWLSEGRLPALRIGGRVRIPAHAVRELSVPYDVARDTAPPAATAGPHSRSRAREQRVARTERLLAQIRAMATGTDGPAEAVALVRAGRDDPRRLP